MPTVGSMDMMPLRCDGLRSEPDVSVPMAAKASPTSAATALPLELPEGSWFAW